MRIKEPKGRKKGIQIPNEISFFPIIISMSTNLARCQTHKNWKRGKQIYIKEKNKSQMIEHWVLRG